MSFLRKLCCGIKEEKVPTTHEAIQKLRETVELLIKKQEFLEKKMETEIETAREDKRASEQQFTQIYDRLTQIESQRKALQGANTNARVLNTMKDAANAMKPEHKDIHVLKVHDLMDDTAEQHDISSEITDTISNNVALSNDIDKDEIERKLEQQKSYKKIIGINVPADTLPDLPVTDPVAEKPKPKPMEEYEDPDTVHLIKYQFR